NLAGTARLGLRPGRRAGKLDAARLVRMSRAQNCARQPLNTVASSLRAQRGRPVKFLAALEMTGIRWFPKAPVSVGAAMAAIVSDSNGIAAMAAPTKARVAVAATSASVPACRHDHGGVRMP